MRLDTEITFIPDRLNQQPTIFIGLTDSELKLAGSVSLVVCTPLFLGMGVIAGSGLLGFGLGIAAAFGLTYLIGRRIRQLKRNRPEGYHLDAINAWLEDHGLKPKSLIRASAVWDIVRTR